MIDLFGTKSRQMVLDMLEHINKQKDLLEQAKQLIIKQQSQIEKLNSQLEFYKMAAGSGVKVVNFPHDKDGGF